MYRNSPHSCDPWPLLDPRGNICTHRQASNLISTSKFYSTVDLIWCQCLWTYKTKKEMLDNNAQHHVCRKPNAARQLSSTVVEAWWFGFVLQPQKLDTLQLLSRTQTAAAWLKYVHATEKAQIYNRIAAKVLQRPSVIQTSPGPCSCKPQFLQRCKDQRAKIPAQRCGRLIKSYRKQFKLLLLNVVLQAAESWSVCT